MQFRHFVFDLFSRESRCLDFGEHLQNHLPLRRMPHVIVEDIGVEKLK